VLDGNPSPVPQGDTAPQFSAHVRYGQTAGWTKMPLGMEVHLSPGDFVLDGDPAPPEKRAQPPPNFWLMSLLWRNGCMDQDATWYRGKPWPRRRCLRWGRGSSFLLKGAQPPVFGPCLLWPDGWMDEDTTWYGSRPRPRPDCVRWGSSSLPSSHHSPKRDTAAPPPFRPMSIVATVAYLSYC